MQPEIAGNNLTKGSLKEKFIALLKKFSSLNYAPIAAFAGDGDAAAASVRTLFTASAQS
jgi:hypothetical protein